MANILVVDDGEQNLANIKLSLHPAGHQILIAKSVDAAKTLLQAASFDLLICGVHLSNGTVFELLNFVKHDPDFRKIPFACFCGKQTDLAKSLDNSMRSAARLLGADRYISHTTFDAEQFQIDIASLLGPGLLDREKKRDTVD